MKKKTIYRTLITQVILSENPIEEGITLEELDDDDTYVNGGYTTKTTELTGKTAVIEIEKAGSTPEFFNMDAQGFELEPDED